MTTSLVRGGVPRDAFLALLYIPGRANGFGANAGDWTASGLPWAKVGDGMKGQGGELSEIKVLAP